MLYVDYNVYYNVDNNTIYIHKIKILIQWYPLQVALHTVSVGSGTDGHRAPNVSHFTESHCSSLFPL